MNKEIDVANFFFFAKHDKTDFLQFLATVTDDDIKNVLKYSDTCQRSILHEVIIHQGKNGIKAFLQRLDDKQLSHLALTIEGTEKNTPLHILASYRDKDCVELLISILHRLDHEALSMALAAKTKDGNTLAHLINQEQDEKSMITFYCEIYLAKLDGNAAIKALETPNSHEMTPIDLAQSKSKSKTNNWKYFLNRLYDLATQVEQPTLITSNEQKRATIISQLTARLFDGESTDPQTLTLVDKKMTEFADYCISRSDLEINKIISSLPSYQLHCRDNKLVPQPTALKQYLAGLTVLIPKIILQLDEKKPIPAVYVTDEAKKAIEARRIWNDVVSEVRAVNQEMQKVNRDVLIERLQTLGYKKDTKQIAERCVLYLRTGSVIVVSFKANFLQKKTQEPELDYHQILNMFKQDNRQDSRYAKKRENTEQAMYSPIIKNNDLLKNFIANLDARPRYGALSLVDPEHGLNAIRNYGRSFLIVDPMNSTFVAGDSLDYLHKYKTAFVPCTDDHFEALLAQCADVMLGAIATRVTTGSFPKDFRHEGGTTTYIEAHLPGIDFLDPMMVRHIHIDEDEAKIDSEIIKGFQQLGITFTNTPRNPYRDYRMLYAQAIDKEEYHSIEDLVEKYPSLKLITDKNGKTGLMKATERGKIDIVQLLLKHGADLAVQDREGKNAISYAEKYGRKEILNLFITEVCRYGAPFPFSEDALRAVLSYLKEKNEETIKIIQRFLSGETTLHPAVAKVITLDEIKKLYLAGEISLEKVNALATNLEPFIAIDKNLEKLSHHHILMLASIKKLTIGNFAQLNIISIEWLKYSYVLQPFCAGNLPISSLNELDPHLIKWINSGILTTSELFNKKFDFAVQAEAFKNSEQREKLSLAEQIEVLVDLIDQPGFFDWVQNTFLQTENLESFLCKALDGKSSYCCDVVKHLLNTAYRKLLTEQAIRNIMTKMLEAFSDRLSIDEQVALLKDDEIQTRLSSATRCTLLKNLKLLRSKLSSTEVKAIILGIEKTTVTREMDVQKLDSIRFVSGEDLISLRKSLQEKAASTNLFGEGHYAYQFFTDCLGKTYSLNQILLASNSELEKIKIWETQKGASIWVTLKYLVKLIVSSPPEDLKEALSKFTRNLALADAIENPEKFAFECPIGKSPIYLPVIAPSGHTFESTTLQQAVGKTKKNPISGDRLEDYLLAINTAIDSLIESNNKLKIQMNTLEDIKKLADKLSMSPKSVPPEIRKNYRYRLITDRKANTYLIDDILQADDDVLTTIQVPKREGPSHFTNLAEIKKIFLKYQNDPTTLNNKLDPFNFDKNLAIFFQEPERIDNKYKVIGIESNAFVAFLKIKENHNDEVIGHLKEARKKSLKKEKLSIEKKTAQIKKEITTLNNEKENYLKTLQDTQLPFDTLKKKIDEKTQLRSQLSKEKKDLKQCLNKTNEKINNLTRENLHISASNRNTKLSVERLSNDITLFSNQLQESYTLQKNLELDVQKKQKEIEDLKNKLETATKKHISDQKDRIATENKVDALIKTYNTISIKRNIFSILTPICIGGSGTSVLAISILILLSLASGPGFIAALVAGLALLAVGAFIFLPLLVYSRKQKANIIIDLTTEQTNLVTIRERELFSMSELSKLNNTQSISISQIESEIRLIQTRIQQLKNEISDKQGKIQEYRNAIAQANLEIKQGEDAMSKNLNKMAFEKNIQENKRTEYKETEQAIKTVDSEITVLGDELTRVSTIRQNALNSIEKADKSLQERTSQLKEKNGEKEAINRRLEELKELQPAKQDIDDGVSTAIFVMTRDKVPTMFSPMRNLQGLFEDTKSENLSVKPSLS